MGYASDYTPVADLFGLPEVPRSGRARLVHVAIELFYRHGFQAVGLDLILKEAGVTKTTFYKHFESRDALLVAAIQQRDEWESAAWKAAIEKIAGDSPQAQLLAMFDVLDIWFNAEDFWGCIFINAAAEFPNPCDPVHEVAAAHKRATRDYFRDLAAAAGSIDPECFADRYTVLVEGTLILRQVHGRNDAARIIKPAVELLMRDSLASETAEEPSLELSELL